MFKSRNLLPGESEAERQKRLVNQLRSSLLLSCSTSPDFSLENEKLSSDKFLRRYLAHSNWSVTKAQSLLHNYIRLNRELEVDTLFTREFPPELEDMFRGYFGGFDYEGRPVALFPEAGGDIRGLLNKYGESIGQLYLQCILRHNMVVERIVLERNVDHGVVVIDAFNLKYWQYLHKPTFDFLLNTAKIVQQHSPGVTGKIIVVNAPRVLKLVVSMMQKIIEFSTEFLIYSSHDNWREKLEEHIPKSALTPHFGGSLQNPWQVSEFQHLNKF